MIDWKDSSIIQVFFEEGYQKGVAIGVELGAIQQARKILLRLIAYRFWEVEFERKGWIESTSDLDLLRKLIDRAVDVQSFDKRFHAEVVEQHWS